MKKLRAVAVYMNSDRDIKEVVIRNLKNISLLARNLQMSEDLESMGYKMVNCVITNNEDLFLKASLQSALLELRSVVASYNTYNQEHSNMPDEVKAKTLILQHEYEEVLMNLVAKRCRHCLEKDIEVSDELALQCYDLYGVLKSL